MKKIMSNEVPLVSISCITYNHAPYIRQCLEGFLMQKTNFKFEVLIHDDASTDGTEEIIREYKSRYPDIIKPIYEEENQWVKGRRGSLTFNYPRAKGKYIALCEGDDYWTDPLKLQKQVEFLEAHPDFSMCFHGAEIVTDLGDVYKNLYKNLESREYSGEEILENWIVPTASVIFKNYKNKSKLEDKRFVFGDIVLFLWAAENGKIYCINEKMSVYRRHKGGVVLGNKRDFRTIITHYTAINEKFGVRYDKVIKRLKANTYAGAFLSGRLKKQSFLVLKEIALNPKYIGLFCYYLIDILIKRLNNN